jgi:hypothetical protein
LKQKKVTVENGSLRPIGNPRPNVVAQAKYVAGLIWVLRKTRWSKLERECYLVSSRWFEKWAAYVDLYRYFNPGKGVLTPLYYSNGGMEDDEVPGLGKEFPGAIDNQCLLADGKDYYHNFNTPQAKCNYVLREGLEEGREYYVVTKEIWDYLHKIYGGMTLRRDCIFIGNNGKTKLDIKMEKVRLLFFVFPKNFEKTPKNRRK